jgi:hypothetical protein
MAVLGREIENRPRGNGRTVPMRLLFGPDHAKLTLQARSLMPILSSVKANNIEAVAYYGRTTCALSGSDGADLTREFEAQGVTIRPVRRPRLHAKVLGWDDNALAVSSFNWLSADPPEATPSREIGVLIEAPRIAEQFFRTFDNARID